MRAETRRKGRLFLCVMVFFAEFDEANCGQHQRGQLRRHHRPPDAVQSPNKGQQHHGRDLADECPDEGDHGGNEAVIKSREHGTGEHIEAAEQEGQGIDPEAPDGHVE